MNSRNLDARFGAFGSVFAAVYLICVSPEEMPGVLGRVANLLNSKGHLLAIVSHGAGACGVVRFTLRSCVGFFGKRWARRLGN